MARSHKKESVAVETQPINLGMRFALIYFAILIGMTFVFLTAPPAHSAILVEFIK